jgi:hypothetical protein
MYCLDLLSEHSFSLKLVATERFCLCTLWAQSTLRYVMTLHGG